MPVADRRAQSETPGRAFSGAPRARVRRLGARTIPKLKPASRSDDPETRTGFARGRARTPSRSLRSRLATDAGRAPTSPTRNATSSVRRRSSRADAPTSPARGPVAWQCRTLKTAGERGCRRLTGRSDLRELRSVDRPLGLEAPHPHPPEADGQRASCAFGRVSDKAGDRVRTGDIQLGRRSCGLLNVRKCLVF